LQLRNFRYRRAAAAASTAAAVGQGWVGHGGVKLDAVGGVLDGGGEGSGEAVEEVDEGGDVEADGPDSLGEQANPGAPASRRRQQLRLMVEVDAVGRGQGALNGRGAARSLGIGVVEQAVEQAAVATSLSWAWSRCEYVFWGEMIATSATLGILLKNSVGLKLQDIYKSKNSEGGPRQRRQ
jgi:hypothetical protein